MQIRPRLSRVQKPLSGRVAWALRPQTPTCLPTPRGCFCDLLGKGSQAPWLGQGPSSPTALPPPHTPGPLVTSALPNRPYARRGMAHPPAPVQSPGGAAEWGGGAGWARASGGWFGPAHPMELILLNKCSKVHNTCYFHKGTHPCNYHPDQETHLSAPQKCPNLKSLGDLSASVDPALPPGLPLQPAKPQISHLDAKGLNQDRKFFPPLCQRVKGTGERVLQGNIPGGGGTHWADSGRCPLAELGGRGSGVRVAAQTYTTDATRGTFLSSLLTPRGRADPSAQRRT